MTVPVQIEEFMRRGYSTPIRGIVHVGANDGEEVARYVELGIPKILCIEPMQQAVIRFCRRYPIDRYPQVVLRQLALGNENREGTLSITAIDGGSSFLKYRPQNRSGPIAPHPDRDKIVGQQACSIRRWADLPGIDRQDYNCCVIDVQGMELDVLRGMDEQILLFDYFVVEVSEIPFYEGEAPAGEVISFLRGFGYETISTVPEHSDMLFVRNTILQTHGLPA